MSCVIEIADNFFVCSRFIMQASDSIIKMDEGNGKVLLF